jgi:catechol 2,3-dioxygenase-like lactoylglutathione lyase family enzyme
MITAFRIATVWVLDQAAAKAFYTEKLGFELHTDEPMGPGAPRWVTVNAKGQPDVQLTLMEPGPPALDPESAEQLRALIAKGVLGAGVLVTDDCRATYRELKAKGVTFVQEPAERPYGVEALLRDDSGNWYSLTQPREQLDHDLPWSDRDAGPDAS